MSERRRRLRLPWRSSARISADIDDELTFHVEMRARELMATGMSEGEARREAVREFGDLDYTRRYCASLDRRGDALLRRTQWLEDLGVDLRHAWRTMARAPGFLAVVLLTLALGIGANTAVFTVVDRVLVASLPYREPDRVVRIYGTDVPDGIQEGQVAAGDYVDYRRRQRTFQDLAAFTWADYTYVGPDRPEGMTGLGVTANFFDVLGTRALLGSTFVTGDDSLIPAAVVVLSHSAWKRIFGGDPGIVGRRIIMSDYPRTVVGVMPAGFISPLREADFWMPRSLAPLLDDANRARKFRNLGMIGRLAPQRTVAAGSADLAAIARDLEQRYPESNTGIGVVAVPIRASFAGPVRAPLLVLMGAAGLVLLIACANVGGMLVARGLARRHEFAVRAALGAGRGRLARQVLAESMALALAGGLLGVALAVRLTQALVALARPALPAMGPVAVDGRALAFACGITAITGLVLGLIPVRGGGRLASRQALHEESRGLTGGPARSRLRATLVVAQMATAVVLVIGAGLLARSLSRLRAVDLGFRPEHVLTFRVELRGTKYDSAAQVIALYEALHERLRALPGVVAVGSTGAIPTEGGARSALDIYGRDVPPGQLPAVGYNSVSDDYFRALGIPLREGRSFEEQDNEKATPAVILSEGAARHFWPGGGAVGARVRLGPDPSQPWAVVVGVVGDVRQDGAAGDVLPTAYVSARQDTWAGRTVVARTYDDPVAVASAARRELRAIDPNVPITELRTMTTVVDESLAGRRLPLWLMSAFALLALVLAAIGVYGVMAYAVTMRASELGVRAALGAQRRDLFVLVLSQGMRTALIALVIGLGAAVAFARSLSSLLFGVAPLDLTTFLAAAAILVACAMAATLIPAQRAMRVDPAATLRGA